MKRLVLLDGMAVTYRAYYALNGAARINSKGMNTGTVLGFAMTLYDLIKKLGPTHMAVAFDLRGGTFRHELFTEYKANREAMPEAVETGLPYIRKFVEAFRIPILTCAGYEADDVIGTASHWAEAQGFDEVLMVSPDKDFGQLVTEHVHLYRFGRMGRPDQVLGTDEVKEWFGVADCGQVKDLLGLWGDSSDNIPGVPGVGEKTAKKLIGQFGSVEELVARVDEVGNERVRRLVREHTEQALLSKQLATIVLNVPLDLSEELLRMRKPDYAALQALMEELEFRNLAKRIFTDLSVADPSEAQRFLKAGRQMPRAKNHDMRGGTEEKDARSPYADVQQPTLFEPTTADGMQVPTIRQLESLPDDGDVAIYVSGATIVVALGADEVYSALVGDIDVDRLRKLLQREDSLKLCYDIKAVRYILRELGIELGGQVFDVRLAHYLVDAEARHTFEGIALGMLGREPETPQEAAAQLWQVYPLVAAQMADAGLDRLYADVELPLVDVLMGMEEEGVRIDVDALNRYSQQLSEERDRLEQSIYALAGTQFNIASPKQLGEVLYERLKVTDKPPRTATKQYSTAEDVLEKLKERHPIVSEVLEYRSLSKLIGTYLDSFPRLINPATGRLHTVYNQTVTATGRLSSSNPNLQNIPIRTERGREIRRAFVARDEGYLLLAADYSQIELRIIASLAGDRHMIEAFANHYDIHAATAAKIYGLPMGEVTKELRRNAKSVNFGIIYGISAFGLSEQLGIPRKEAAGLIEEYFTQYPDIKNYIDTNIAFAREHGYAQTLLGRRRYLPDINSRNASARSFAERNAVNMPVQGTSADMIKIAMIRIHREFERLGLRSKMILQVHDELVFDCYRPEVEQVRSVVQDAMVNALPLSIPIEVDIGVGDNWLEAHGG
ncbi:MAG: DNA polymerase I [Bacteroidales bacterium]|nr:DNA polymerase I [Bacteroidales bacterium]